MKQGLIWGRFLPIESFDMTPIIDVVFLLIIFFMLVCQFIAAENFQVQVPDNIGTANPVPPEQDLMTTVTVMEDADSRVRFAVGSEVLAVSDPDNASEQIASAIDKQLRLLNPKRRIVRLRCAKTLPFGVTKHALEGISKSSATDIQWAVLRNE